MNVLHTPPGVSHVAEMTVNPQKTGKSVNLNDLTTIELKEVLKGEGLSDKGKVKADFVERLRKHAVELGDENYTFILRKYPQFVKRTTPIMSNDGNEGDGESKNRCNTESALMHHLTVSIESRMGNTRNGVDTHNANAEGANLQVNE